MKYLNLIIQFLPQLVKLSQSAPVVMKFLVKVKEAMKQDTERTPEQEAAFDAYEEEITSQPHWKPRNQ